jgi:predicted HAD superfamily Cof-like phosphohydrolase
MEHKMAQNLTKKEMVEHFHLTYGAFINKDQKFPESNVRELRQSLLEEEFDEYIDAEKRNDFTEVCDALGDMLYIIYGTAVSYGIPIDEIFNEIHMSNMSKLGEDGKPIYRDDGKVLKGPNYFKPKINKILDENIAKLQKRYPDKYSDFHASARLDKAEATWTEP